MSRLYPAANRRMVRSLLAAGLACLISGIAVIFAVLIPSASATGNSGGDGGNPGGNVTCEDLGLEALFPKVDPPKDVDNEFVTANVYRDGKKLDVTAKDGFVVKAVIVKGGDASNVYDQPPFVGMHAPLKNDKKPEISHYEVCGCPEKTETPTDEPTKPTEEPTTPTKEPTTPVVTPTVPAGPQLPETGSTNGWLAAVGALLLAAGSGLVLYGRRAGRHAA
ncbi:MAG TPA: LPXTG cell wall anchor domain-containing protein [Jiangellaceae bacterium]